MLDMDDVLSLGENTDDTFDSDVIADNADKNANKVREYEGKSRVRSGDKRKASKASSKPSIKSQVNLILTH